MFKRIANQNVLITGASAGIGRSTALVFAEYGANVIVTARRADRLTKLEDEIKEKFPAVKVQTVAMDVSDEESIKAGFAALPEWARHIDVLVNNAGLGQGSDSVKDLKTADMDSMINTNIKGLIWVAQQVLPQMLERDSGTIINIGSILGVIPSPTVGMYSATKFAVNAITQTLQMETNESNVRVIEVKPGIVDSDFNVVRYHGDKQASDAFYNAVPSIPAQDVAETILFAASRDQRCVISDVSVSPNGQANTLTTRINRTKQ